MRALYERIVMVTTMLFVALAIAQGGSTAVLVASIAAVAVASVVAVRYAALVTGSRELVVGERAHAHREALSGMPEPSHPSTAGRPLTRAPARSIQAA
jgi:disulfide bond formation protein DsbB